LENYAALLFTDAVKAYQAKVGMDEKYEKIYETRFRDDLDIRTTNFLTTRTSFYMATLNAEGWPYIQHRGGPEGFIKILGPDTIGFADYLGNRQFITRGNLDHSSRVSLFFMDYPNRARLNMQGEARMVDAADEPALAETLSLEGEGPVERLVTIKILARDWNCPKYILPRYSEHELTQIIAPKINAVEAENRNLKARIAELEAGTLNARNT
jgi:predicted pyridoxine 5'-phosphate oxidase superfamily flavin-nucleotide-binding protein